MGTDLKLGDLRYLIWTDYFSVWLLTTLVVHTPRSNPLRQRALPSFGTPFASDTLRTTCGSLLSSSR